MSLKEYEVVVNGMTTTMRLDEEDARRAGVWQDSTPATKQAEPKPNKSRTPRNKAASGGDAA